ncbi:WLM domain-containing protein [Phascolomyces articulosus]|uniref:WLM domain-containing protein n=1 Tax=Phascolomyces articulosus TaxID=60185 RepID=A0AAD5PCX0_9FUNG|nr:WLM domain-containing protein [Phascolomyces articulosus]
MDNVIQNYTVLKRKTRSDEALQLLKRVASQVKPIMRKRGWKVVHFCEFFPTNPNLLGVNVNRGYKINIRLRPHYDDSAFLEYNDLLGTMLHELTHIVRVPHDNVFYKILDELNDELDNLLMTGQKGYLAFDGQGNKLGNGLGSTYGDSRSRALAAAEQRRKTQGMMIPVGGVRLGGEKKNRLEKSLTPAQMAARAAERRIQDKKWCGGMQLEQESTPSSPFSSSSKSPEVITIPDSSDEENDYETHGQKRSRNDIDTHPPTKKPIIKIPDTRPPINSNSKQVSSSTSETRIQPSKQEETQIGWICGTCTFQNTPLILACGMCFTQRPTSHTVQDTIHHWSCPQCTLYNESSTITCSACDYSR